MLTFRHCAIIRTLSVRHAEMLTMSTNVINGLIGTINSENMLIYKFWNFFSIIDNKCPVLGFKVTPIYQIYFCNPRPENRANVLYILTKTASLAFNALIHKHRPDLLQYDALSQNPSTENAIKNLETGFKKAEQLGIARLLDPEDVAVDHPDEKSIITYVVSYYHYFNAQAKKGIESNRIGNILDAALNTEANITKTPFFIRPTGLFLQNLVT